MTFIDCSNWGGRSTVHKLSGIVLLLLAGLQPGNGLAQADNTADDNRLAHAIAAGKAGVDLRYRYEWVDDADFSNDANASTARLRLNYQTLEWQDWSALAEFDYVGEILVNDFNSGGGTSSPPRSVYPVVADPKGADLNQLYFDYSGFADSHIRIGRQRINLDNQRFVGGVGWRQNEQTFDAFSISSTRIQRTDLFYAFIGRVNRIFGDKSFSGNNNTNTHILNAKIKVDDAWTVSPYLYRIDDDSISAFSTLTLGVRALGSIAVATHRFDILAEFATQSDAANNPVSYDAQYYHLKLDWPILDLVSLGFGFESLGGDANNAGSSFRTPLATLHPFQGWADQLLLTPDAGVNDFYLSAEYRYQKWRFGIAYHDFGAADGSGSWGNEIDLSASRTIGDRYSLLLKGAIFSASDAPFSDARKLWLQLQARY